MIWLLLGALVLFTLVATLRAFERASVGSIKALLAWIAALGGLTLALLLVLTGRGGAAVGALVMFGPLIWQKIQASRMQSFARRARANAADQARRGGQGHGGPGHGGPGHGGLGGGGPGRGGAGGGARQDQAGARGPGRSGSTMSRREAYEILGLAPGAAETEVREAHHRLMRRAHPDVGGSAWLATRINQARDVLLG